MTKETLKTAIDGAFETRRAFIAAFNETAGVDALDETTLSRQLSGRIALSGGYAAAYGLFFYIEKILIDVQQPQQSA